MAELLCAGLLALMVDIESLAQLVSIGTLFVFFCVCAGCLRRRYYEAGRSAPGPLITRCVVITLFNLGGQTCVCSQSSTSSTVHAVTFM